MPTGSSTYPMVGGSQTPSTYPMAGQASLLSNAVGMGGNPIGPMNAGQTEAQTPYTADQPTSLMGGPYQNPWTLGEKPGSRGPLDYPQ